MQCISFTLKTTQQSEREIDCHNKFKYSHYPLEKKSSEQYLLREMCPYSAYARKYGPENMSNTDTFHAVLLPFSYIQLHLIEVPLLVLYFKS